LARIYRVSVGAAAAQSASPTRAAKERAARATAATAALRAIFSRSAAPLTARHRYLSLRRIAPSRRGCITMRRLHPILIFV
jgi:hypothetical protein